VCPPAPMGARGQSECDASSVERRGRGSDRTAEPAASVAESMRTQTCKHSPSIVQPRAAQSRATMYRAQAAGGRIPADCRGWAAGRPPCH
jgi:hypothetical protein